MNIYKNILTTGLTFSSLSSAICASQGDIILSCRDRVSGKGRLDLEVTKEEDGRYHYYARSCSFPVFSGCESYEYDTDGYLMPQPQSEASPNRFTDGNVSIYPASDIAYVLSDAHAKVQLYFKIETCRIKPRATEVQRF